MEKRGRETAASGRALSHSERGREGREGCAFTLLALVILVHNLAVAFVLMSRVGPHP